MSWETELYSMYVDELRDVLDSVRNKMSMDVALTLPMKFSTFFERVVESFGDEVDRKYIYDVCAYAFFLCEYDKDMGNYGVKLLVEHLFPVRAAYTTEFTDVILKIMSKDLQNIL